jgi:hypothetical protein
MFTNIQNNVTIGKGIILALIKVKQFFVGQHFLRQQHNKSESKNLFTSVVFTKINTTPRPGPAGNINFT